MAWRKKEELPEDIEIRRIVKSSRVPILILDNQWHELFPDYKKTAKIRELEKQINELLKRQGKITEERKEMKKLKQRLMGEIISNISEDAGETGRFKQKKQEKSQKLILEINEKLQESEEELDSIPGRIERTNQELLVESLRIWHNELEENTQQIEMIDAWITDAREKLKENILRKQDMEDRNDAMYSYMHNLLGAKLMEQIDVTRNK